jgi:hypothetical protein
MQLSAMQRSEPSTSQHPTSPSPMKTRRGEVDEQIAARARAKEDVAVKANKRKETAKARAAANAKAQKQRQQAKASKTLGQAQKEARMRHSINSLRDGISAAWTDKPGMHKCNDEGERVPKTWPELDKRHQAVVSGALRPLLMPGNDPAFFSNEMRRMSEQARLALLDDFIKLFPDDLKHKLKEAEVASALDIESAADLWLSLRVKHSQWDQLAAELNKQLSTKEKYKRGVMPRTDTIIKWLIDNGARLQFEDVLGADMNDVGAEELDVVDLVSDDELENEVSNAGATDLAATEDAQKPNKGYIVKNAMTRIYGPELEAMEMVYPGAAAYWIKHGIDVVIGADGTAVLRFNGKSIKLEVCMGKVIVPDTIGGEGAQQQPCLGIPLFMHDGDECYKGMKATLYRMFKDGHLSDNVTITYQGQEQEIKVRWHLCADLKLVTLVCGLGGATMKRPCFSCLWDRSNPAASAEERTLELTEQQAQWAVELFGPFHAASAQMKAAKKALNAHQMALDKAMSASTKQGSQSMGKTKRAPKSQEDAAHEDACAAAEALREQQHIAAMQKQQASRTAELSAKLDAATLARDAALKVVREKIAKLAPDDHFMLLLSDATWLQSLSFVLPLHQFADCTPRADSEGPYGALHDELHELWGYKQDCCKEVETTEQKLAGKRKLIAEASEWQTETPRYEEMLSDCKKLEDKLECYVFRHADAATSWLQLVQQVNEAHGLVVRQVSGGALKMLLPRPAPASLSMANIKNLCTEVCAGVMQQDLLAEYIPQERRWIEGLHLCLNTVNAAYEHARDTLHFLLNPDGSVRDLAGLDPDKWPRPNSGSIQSRAWTELGFNFQAHLVEVLGPKLVRPLTKFHGSQCADMMKDQDVVFDSEPLKPAMEALAGDKDLGVLIKALKSSWTALSGIHALVNEHPLNIAKLERHVSDFRAAMCTFEFEATPHPCKRKRLFYEHAIIDHLVKQGKRLHAMGLSFARVQSRYLESNNRVVKGRYKTLPGGGKQRHESYGNDPLFLTLIHLYAHNWVKRRLLWKNLKRKRDGQEAAEIQRSQESELVQSAEVEQQTGVHEMPAAGFRVCRRRTV